MKKKLSISILFFLFSACTFTVGVHRHSSDSPSRTVTAISKSSDNLTVLVAEYETELTRYCNDRLIASETCAEQRRLIMAFRQSANKRPAYEAWNSHANEIEHPYARKPLLTILERIERTIQ